MSRLGLVILSMALAASPAFAAPRTVPAAAAVQSAKRGLAVQGADYPAGLSLTQADLDALSPGLSWYYNWSATTSQVDGNGHMEFLPMAWGHSGDNVAVATWLSSHPETTTVLSANEPNLSSQDNMSQADCATFIEDTVSHSGGRPVIGPHLAAGSGPTDYRNGVHALLPGGLKASAIHVYETTTSGFSYWATTWPHTGWTGGPTPPTDVWMKEINYGDGSASEDTVIDFMIYGIDLLERDSRVVRYAWWKDRRKYDGAGFTRPPTHFILSNTDNGQLTTLGSFYVNMPVHDPDVYYALPGRVEVERYSNISGLNPPATMDGNVHVARTGDSVGVFDVADVDNGEWIEVNVDVTQPGTWTMQLCGKRATAGTSTIAVKHGSATLASLPLTTGAGSYALTPQVTFTFDAAGRQTLRLEASADTVDTSLNWIAFVAPNGATGTTGDPGTPGTVAIVGTGAGGDGAAVGDSNSAAAGDAATMDGGATGKAHGCGQVGPWCDLASLLLFYQLIKRLLNIRLKR